MSLSLSLSVQYKRTLTSDLHVLFQIVGLNTNIRFLDSLAGHAEFAAGNVHTGFIEQHYSDLFPRRTLSDPTLCKAALALILKEYNSNAEQAFTKSSGTCTIKASFTRSVNRQRHCFKRHFSSF